MKLTLIPLVFLVVLGIILPHAYSDTMAETIKLHSDTPTSIHGMNIQVIDVKDSRCPSDVTCVWAGQVNVTLSIQDTSSVHTASLVSTAGKSSTVLIDNYIFEIASVTPYPKSGMKPSLSDYDVSLGLTSNSSNDIRLLSDSKMCLAGVDTCVMAHKFHLAPLKQLRVGIGALDVNCKDGFELLLKSTNNMPACVKSSNSDTLIQRGWALTHDDFIKLKTTLEPNQNKN